jgi:DNA helicase HerA-like ATPase
VADDLHNCGIELGENTRFSVRGITGQWANPPDEKIHREMRDVLFDGINNNQVTILDSRGLAPEERHNLFTYCAKTVWSGRVEGRIEPALLIVEEGETLDNDVLQRIASEGKKVGISMCLMSQHPVDIGGRALSQIGSQIVGRTTDANDSECLKNMVTEKSVLLPKLRTGEWIVNGITLRWPTLVTLRDRYSLSRTR